MKTFEVCFLQQRDLSYTGGFCAISDTLTMNYCRDSRFDYCLGFDWTSESLCVFCSILKETGFALDFTDCLLIVESCEHCSQMKKTLDRLERNSANQESDFIAADCSLLRRHYYLLGGSYLHAVSGSC